MYVAMIFFLFKNCREHLTPYDNRQKSEKYKREKAHKKEFHNWLEEEVD